MGFSTSIVVIAVGAILRFAVSVTTTGFNLHTIGLILIIVGMLLSIMFWQSWGGFGGRRERLDGALDAVAAPPGPGREGLTQSTAYVAEERADA